MLGVLVTSCSVFSLLIGTSTLAPSRTTAVVATASRSSSPFGADNLEDVRLEEAEVARVEAARTCQELMFATKLKVPARSRAVGACAAVVEAYQELGLVSCDALAIPPRSTEVDMRMAKRRMPTSVKRPSFPGLEGTRRILNPPPGEAAAVPKEAAVPKLL